MRWAGSYVPVPLVLDEGSFDGLEWMLTRALPGVNATAPELLRDPHRLVPILAAGLRTFHEALPVEVCPFDFRVARALEHVNQRLATGAIDFDRDLHPEHRHLDRAGLLAELQRLRPATEDLVVCHGDYCLPNVLIQGGRVTGFVDLGELGVANRWWDLAVATWSVTWNLGPGWEDAFLHAYGVPRDDSRIAFYRILYDLAS